MQYRKERTVHPFIRYNTMKRAIRCLCGSFLLCLLLSGCGRISETTEEGTDISVSSGESHSYEFLEDKNPVGRDDSYEEMELAWKDNSLDDWQAAMNLTVKEVKADGEQIGGAVRYFVGEGGAVRFKNHLVGSYKKNWSGASGINAQGAEFAETIAPDADLVGMQADLLGPVAGGTGYVAYRDEYDDNYDITGQCYYVLDEAFHKIRSVSAKEPFDVPLTDIAGDSRGNFHILLRNGSEGCSYVVLSQDGERVVETTGSYEGLRILEDGRVFACEEVMNDNKTEGQRLLEADPEKGTLKEVAAFSLQTIIDETKAVEYAPSIVTAKSETELVWCGKEGVYLCNAQGKETRMAYRWDNHGIVPREVMDVYAKTDGTIGLVYKDGDGIRYLQLKPTPEETPITTITFAVSPRNKEAFVSAVAAFNKKYPTYNIEIKDDYEQTPLLTRLGAGDGPVLIDTALTGFDGLEKLWQPLDGFLESSALADELIPQALEFGKIGDRTYGIVTNFSIRTLVVKDKELLSWDYDAFLDAVEHFDGAVMTYEYNHGLTDSRKAFFDMLENGPDDTAYLDAETGTLLFGTPGFERVRKLAEKARECPPSEDGKSLQNEKVLCEIVNVYGVETLAGLREKLEQGNLYAAGYPTKNGAKHLLAAQYPIAVRSTATDEEKQMAYTFLKILLSHDSVMQGMSGSTANTYFSVRKEILEEQFEHYELVYSMNKGYNDALPELNREKDGALYEELLGNSVVQKSFPATLQSVFDEEIGAYLTGEISGDLLDRHLKSRVGLYLEENQSLHN